MYKNHLLPCLVLVLALGLASCVSEDPEGIALARPADTTVKMDFFHRPLPDIPLPNDIATRADPSAPTGRRVNASLIAPTVQESQVRTLLSELDGWGVFQPISIPFTGPLDVQSILDGHRDPDYRTDNDVIYLVNVDKKSPEFGKVHHLDLGNGNYPVALERFDYWDNGLRDNTVSLVFEEVDEDVNGNGILDPGEDSNRNGELDPGEDLNGNGVLDPPEDTDADGVLDKPNYYPGANPDPSDRAARYDALMTFYERETNTIIARPLVPLNERTTYAVLVTRRLRDEAGKPVGSPYKYVHHLSQAPALEPLKEVMPDGLELDDLAFAFTFTTQSVQSDWIPVREGLYGVGPQKHLAEEFPAELSEVFQLRDESRFPDATKRHLLYSENLVEALSVLAGTVFGISPGNKEYEALLGAQEYIDYHVLGSFKSPQLFARNDASGTPLPLNLQSWPNDMSVGPVAARAEEVPFWLVVPRKEVSARGKGKPAPLVILGHGYSSSRLESLIFVGYLVRHGFAVMAIDGVSHGIGNFDSSYLDLAKLLLGGFGLESFAEAALIGRAVDTNNDDIIDSGADFWTAYLFHTRDVLRQTLLDHIQLVKLMRTFDGEQRWDFDLNGDGEKELAGDFDCDGVPDISREYITMTGGSLGGIMASLLGATEPHVDGIAPISAGGGLSDVGQRSTQFGVREAVMLRVLGPMVHGNLDAEAGAMLFRQVVPDAIKEGRVPIAAVGDVKSGDTIRGVNLVNDEVACGYVDGAGRVRFAIPSDKGDAWKLEVYRGPALVHGSTECEVVEGASPYATVDSFQIETEYQGEIITAGTSLTALEDGLGLRRANPELRRFLGIGQMVMDRADPAVFAKHLSSEPLYYPGLHEYTGAFAMLVTTMGDMAVPASAGMTLGRSARLIDYLNVDERYGVPPNQKLLETFTAEAVHSNNRYTQEGTGAGVHIDIENFSEGTDLWGDSIPRLDPPMRLWADKNSDGKDLQAISGAIFPYPIPEGQHGFPFPGQLPDKAIKACRSACAEGEDCQCDKVETFDTGYFLFNMLAEYFKSHGQTMRTDFCYSRNDCSFIPPAPTPRDTSTLD